MANPHWVETSQIRCYCRTCRFNGGVYDHEWNKCKRDVVVINDVGKCLSRRDR